MQQSESVLKILPALAKAQLEMRKLKKNKTNTFTNSKYADLGVVLDEAKRVLSDNGLMVVQLPTGTMGIGLSTTLFHIASGEFLTDSIVIDAAGKELKANNFIQVAGQGITYLRRYALNALLMGISEDDKDGNYSQQKPALQPRSGQPAGEKKDDKPAEVAVVTDELWGDWAKVKKEAEAVGLKPPTLVREKVKAENLPNLIKTWQANTAKASK